ncbi:protocadherin gamma-B5-like isoform X13 [Spea bombifrons]|uniref:protocadherin gamma-B5-like isoform X13 n=1 Tax=Spea bombifrons TaxID=233779 RepID=UPI00234BE785|nr:protocadherin gamma-B5-like isoform X13 [Spea bombifrons]
MDFQKIQEKKIWKSVKWQVMYFALICSYSGISGQLHYSIHEETKKDFLVGNIAKDLGLKFQELALRKFRISSVTSERLFYVNLENGNLFVSDRIDRESLCEMTTNCILKLEAVVENPFQVFHVEVEILDINDNPPIFSKNVINLEISESTPTRTRFVLGNALDPDIGINSLQSYKISENNYFKLGQKTGADGQKYPELILENPLDYEKQSEIDLILTACDGGNPSRTGTAMIKIIVSDINDNTPVFQKDLYEISIVENAPIDSLVIHLNAVDEDDGINGQVTYSFTRITKVGQQVFTLNPQTGEIKTKGHIDFETTKSYEMIVEAEDGGGLVSHCKVVINIVDANDNAPEIILTSVSSVVSEDSLPGTVIALINIRDLDSDLNGDVKCQLEGSLPFEIISSSSSYYRLVTSSTLDREDMDSYNITIRATDKGSPPLSTTKTIKLDVSDVNDNAPIFEQAEYAVFIPENKPSGSSIYSIQASDLDTHDNSKLVYSIVSKNIDNVPVSSYISINSMTGVLYAQRQFDYEQLREFDFQIMAKDNGSPSLHSNATVRICITDQNDNSPRILYPSTDGSALFEIVPRSSNKGYLVTKVVAVDADSGHNAWLSYQFLQAPEKSYFTIGQHTGEIRTSRVFQDTELLKHKVIVLVKDHGNPPLSATVTLNLVVAENFQKEVSEMNIQSKKSDFQSNLNVYLVIGLAIISFLFTITVMLAIILRCRKQSNPQAFGSLATDMYSQVGPKFPTNFNNGTLTLPYPYDVCVALDSTDNEFTFIKPTQNVPTDTLISTDDSGIGINALNDSTLTDCNTQQAQPNTDWRFSQAQRPGPSGAQPTEEAGVWPNNQFETERLQAMILASANEAAEGSSALGGGTGTMGLSARYGPQFTLQHVPDYRQNIYIPGTTSTLTNAAGKRDGKAAAPSGGNKKKSGKKDKK